MAIKNHEKSVKHTKNLHSFNLQPSINQFLSKPASSPDSQASQIFQTMFMDNDIAKK